MAIKMLHEGWHFLSPCQAHAGRLLDSARWMYLADADVGLATCTDLQEAVMGNFFDAIYFRILFPAQL
jgi:hypothetical protein